MTSSIQELKKSGFLKQVQSDRFSLRVKTVGGQVDAKDLVSIHDIAKKYGNGYIHLTSRQSIEIPYIRLEDIEAVKKALEDAGLKASPTGPRVRTITACQGGAICGSGLIDTTALAQEFDERYGGRDLNHKFKIGITGCRNNCLKAEENDLGVKGAMVPSWNSDPCTYCGLCQKKCPVQAITVNKGEMSFVYDETACVACGRCVKACPTQALEGEGGYLVFFGGLFGNKITVGAQLLPIIQSKEQLHQVVEATLQFFKVHGRKGERFFHTLERVGWDTFRQHLSQFEWVEACKLESQKGGKV